MSSYIDYLTDKIDELKKIVIISQLGMVFSVYTTERFIELVNDEYLDDDKEHEEWDKITDLSEAIDYYDKHYKDDCLTIDVMEVEECRN